MNNLKHEVLGCEIMINYRYKITSSTGNTDSIDCIVIVIIIVRGAVRFKMVIVVIIF